MIVYQIKSGFRISQKYAQPAGEIMKQLEAENRLTAADLVNVSRPEDAPLHDYFEWDDAKAAEKFRETQGKNLIEAVVEVIENPSAENDGPVEVEIQKAFYAVGTGNHNYYHIDTIVQDDDKSQQLFEMAFRELKAFERRYAIIKDKLKTVFDAIDTLDGREGETE